MGRYNGGNLFDDNLFLKDNYGYLLEGLPMHPSLFFPFFPNNLDSFSEFIKSYNNWSGSIVLTSDTSSGSIINKYLNIYGIIS